MHINVPEHLWRDLAAVLEDEEAVLQPVSRLPLRVCMPESCFMLELCWARLFSTGGSISY